MVGKFDATLVFKPGSNELDVAGTLSGCEPADAGKEVEITVTRLEQNGRQRALQQEVHGACTAGRPRRGR